MNPSKTQAYFEFVPKNGTTPMKYPLGVGPTTIGTRLSYDIRIKSKNLGTEPLQCVLDMKENGMAVLENRCKHPIMYNNSKMKKVQILKNNDEIMIAGKHFRYVNLAPTTKINHSSVTSRTRQSVTPNFRVKTGSKIPIPCSTISTRRSYSASKPPRSDVRRSCLTGLATRKRSIYDWDSINMLNVKAGKSAKSDSLAVQVRKSLFLKNKGDISFSNSISLDSPRKSLVLKVGGSISSPVSTVEKVKTPSPRGVKRKHQSSSRSVSKITKKRKYKKLSFNVSVSGESDLFGDSSSSSEPNSSIDDSSLGLLHLEDSSRSFQLLKSPLQPTSTTRKSKTPLNDPSDVRGVKKIIATPEPQKSPVKNDLTDSQGGKRILRTSKSPKSPLNDLLNVSGLKRIMNTPKIQKSPKNDLTEVKGVKYLLRTPKIQKLPNNDLNVKGVKSLLKSPKLQKAPKNDLTVVKGVKSLLKTPKIQKSPKNDLNDVKGVKSLLKTPKPQKAPKNDLTDVKGVKSLLKTPKIQKSPKNDLNDVKGVKRLLRTPKPPKAPKNDLTDVKGVKNLLKTPKLQKPPLNDLRDVKGVKKLLKTPKALKSPKNDLLNISGVKRILRTPKIQKSPLNDLRDIKGVKKLLTTPRAQKSPLNDLTDVRGVKKFLTTPKDQKSPRNDLLDVGGVKQIFKSPKIQKSPKNDLSDFKGVKKLMSSPRVQKTPKNDLADVRGVKKMFATPKTRKSPKNDLSNVSGIQSLLTSPVEKSVRKRQKTPKAQKMPRNDLTDVRGVKKLVATPKPQKEPKNDLSDLEGVSELFATPGFEVEEIVQEVSTRSLRKKKPVDNLQIDSSNLPSTPGSSRRGRRKQPITSTPAQEPDTPQKRSRRKKSMEMTEPNLKIEESAGAEENMPVRSTRGRKRKTEDDKVEVVEVIQKKSARGRKKVVELEEDVENEEKTGRGARGRKKENNKTPRTKKGGNKEEQGGAIDDSLESGLESKDLAESHVEEVAISTNKRGRRGKAAETKKATKLSKGKEEIAIVEESVDKEENSSAGPLDKHETDEEVTNVSKRGKRGKAAETKKTTKTSRRKNEVAEVEIKAFVEPLETNDVADVSTDKKGRRGKATDAKKATKGGKRKNEEEIVILEESVTEESVATSTTKRARRGKNISTKHEGVEDSVEPVESTNKRGRKAKATSESTPILVENPYNTRRRGRK